MGFLGDSLEDYYPYQLVDEATKQVKDKTENMNIEDIRLLHNSISDLIHAIEIKLRNI